MAKRPGGAGDPLWYKDAISYELHVRAFKDSNGDGIGDFPGLIQKRDYLQDRGSAVCGCSPSFRHLQDDGYDISDYMNVHSMYGTIDDFRFFLAAAHECTLQFSLARSSREGDACWR
jgi:maltose alpha-D-glucosyltransferase/alpha-amylase